MGFLIQHRDEKGALVSARIERNLEDAQATAAGFAMGGDFSRAFSRRMNDIMTWDGTHRLVSKGVTMEAFK